MKTLKDRRVMHPSIEENIYWEEDLKQAIRDLRDKLKVYEMSIISPSKKGSVLVLRAHEKGRLIDEIFGVWEE